MAVKKKYLKRTILKKVIKEKLEKNPILKLGDTKVEKGKNIHLR